MSKVKAITSFSGLVTGYNGQVIEIEDDYILQDLLKAGYIELINKSEGIDTNSLEDVDVKEPDGADTNSSEDDDVKEPDEPDTNSSENEDTKSSEKSDVKSTKKSIK